MLVQLIYASTPIANVAEAVQDFIPVAIKENAKFSITGMLVTTPTCYVQLLEGDRAAINQLYFNIIKDNRHSDCTILRYVTIPNREFNDWAMIHTNLHDLNSAYIEAIFENASVTPTYLTGVQALSLIRYVAARLVVDSDS